MEEEQKNTPNMKLAKPGDYYLTLRFTWENLRLDSGPMRDIYSIIYGFSHDGASSCASTIKHFMDWTGASKREVLYILQALEEAGYITRERVGRGPNSYTEYRACLDIVEACRIGAKYAPIKIGAKRSNNRCKITQKKVQILHPISNNIIIYNKIILPRVRAEEARTKEELYKFFFWKNAAKPQVEVEGFWRSAELAEWKDNKGRDLDTQKKVIVWADGWEIRGGSPRTDPKFLKFWNWLYAWLLVENNPMANALGDLRIRGTVSETTITIALSKDLQEWFEGTLLQLPPDDPKIVLLNEFRKGREIIYEPFVL